MALARRPRALRASACPLEGGDPASTDRVCGAFAGFFGDRFADVGAQSASEDFGDIPTALGVPCTYWFVGGTDAEAHAAAEAAGRVAEDVPVNHSAGFAPVVQPTLDTGTQALVVAALGWLAP